MHNGEWQCTDTGDREDEMKSSPETTFAQNRNCTTIRRKETIRKDNAHSFRGLNADTKIMKPLQAAI